MYRLCFAVFVQIYLVISFMCNTVTPHCFAYFLLCYVYMTLHRCIGKGTFPEDDALT